MAPELDEVQLGAAARAYVHESSSPGGFAEAFAGVRHKTIPHAFRLAGGITPIGLSLLVARFLLAAGAALVAILIRKTLVSAPSGPKPKSGIPALMSAVSGLDATDYLLALLAVIFTVVPRVLEARARRMQMPARQSPYPALSRALQRMPALPLVAQPAAEVEDALFHCLNALKTEIAELVGESDHGLADVTLLEFVDEAGTLMQVRARTRTTEAQESVGKQLASYRFLAYYVARSGNWWTEHDFKNARNPFPKKRLTVRGNRSLDYRSVLFLPLCIAVRTQPTGGLVDRCIGVICVHCAKPYRFWRWGDHRKVSGGFGDVAYERALPYIALITKLIEPYARKVDLEGG